MHESRVKKSLLNAKVNMFFYFVTLVISFFSRKIFLDYLGADFMGFTGTLGNLMSFLNLADLGIGSTIGYVLYKPLFDNDRKKINEIISVFGYLYRIVGSVILVAGILLSFFLPLIFPDIPFSASLVYYTFFAMLTGNLFGYFINYRYTLFGADQKSYLVTMYFQTANVFQTLIQMALIFYTRNLYLWVTIGLLFNCLYCFILNWKIKQVYPWLTTSIALGKLKHKEYGIIFSKAKQMFVHVLAGNVRSQFLPFLIYAFASLKTVAYYGNYTLIADKMTALLGNVLNSTGAGVGNMIAEGNKDKIQHVYWELHAIRFFLSSVISFGFYLIVGPFIALWLGREYILPDVVCILITFNIFLKLIRGTNDQFIYGYGLYHDTWAPVVTLLITAGVALVAGYFWGLVGVLIGDIISVLIIIRTWKPYLLFTQGFKCSVKEYWIGQVPYYISMGISWGISLGLSKHFMDWDTQSYITLFVFAFFTVLLFSVLLLVLCYLSCPGMRYASARIVRQCKRKTVNSKN